MASRGSSTRATGHKPAGKTAGKATTSSGSGRNTNNRTNGTAASTSGAASSGRHSGTGGGAAWIAGRAAEANQPTSSSTPPSRSAPSSSPLSSSIRQSVSQSSNYRPAFTGGGGMDMTLTMAISDNIMNSNANISNTNTVIGGATATTGLAGFIEGELDSHSCPVCYEVMQPPEKAPILLFPCGHTFCNACLSKSTSNQCPLCRTVVATRAVNFSLQQVITSLAAKRRLLHSVESSHGHGPPPAVDKTIPGALGEALIGKHSHEVQKYLSDYRTYQTRCMVLSNRVIELNDGLTTLASEQSSSMLVVDHLAREETALMERMAALQAELSLLRSHQQSAADRSGQLRDKRQHTLDQLSSIHDTLSTLTHQRDKAKVLLSALVPGLDTSLLD